MMCVETRSLLSAFIDEELDSKRAADVRGHLEACGSCRQESASLTAIKEAVRAMPLPNPPASLEENLRSVLSERPRRRLWRHVAVAAALLGMTAVAFLVMMRRQDATPEFIASVAQLYDRVEKSEISFCGCCNANTVWDRHASFAKELSLPRHLSFVGFCPMQRWPTATYRIGDAIVTVTVLRPEELPDLPRSAAVPGRPRCYEFNVEGKKALAMCEEKGSVVYCTRSADLDQLLSATPLPGNIAYRAIGR